jgi:hypothetical protein
MPIPDVQPVTPELLRSLLDSLVPENRTLDYKERLPGTADGEKKEFLADICSFANAEGGLLIYGVSEVRDEQGRPTGVPASVPGIPGLNVDSTTLRLEQLLTSGISPRIRGVRIRGHANFEEGRAIIAIEVPRSWNGPHMVTFQSSSRFWGRNSAGKYQFDIDEIRDGFLRSEFLADRLRSVRDETPVPLRGSGRILLQVLPFQAFTSGFTLDLRPLDGLPQVLKPFTAGSWGGYFNFDGYYASGVDSTGEPTTSYVQFFRNGAAEALDTWLLRDSSREPLASASEERSIPSVRFEREIIEQLQRLLTALHRLGIEAPVAVALSLLNVRGFVMARPFEQRISQPGLPIDRDHLLVPEIVLQDLSASIPAALRPIFDAVWQATGLQGSSLYDADGNWTGAGRR